MGVRRRVKRGRIRKKDTMEDDEQDITKDSDSEVKSKVKKGSVGKILIGTEVYLDML